jgi:hypothetical protein
MTDSDCVLMEVGLVAWYMTQLLQPNSQAQASPKLCLEVVKMSMDMQCLQQVPAVFCSKKCKKCTRPVSYGSGFVRTVSQCMFLSANRASFNSQLVSQCLGGFSSPCVHHIFYYVMVKIFLGKLCAVGKLSSISIYRYIIF